MDVCPPTKIAKISEALREDASKNMKIAEGLWFSYGRGPRKFALFLVRDFVLNVQSTAVIFGSEKEVSKPAGWWTVRMQTDAHDKAHMVLGFHHTNTVCDHTKVKHLYLAGRNVWRDTSNYEALVLFGIASDGAGVDQTPDVDSVNLTKTSFLRTQEAWISTMQISSDVLAQVKLALAWNHPGSPVEYVLLLKDHQIIFHSVSGQRSDPHGLWEYFIADGVPYLGTHFHFEGRVNENGRPLALPTLLKSIAPEDVETTLFDQEVFFAVGTEKERTAHLATRFVPVDDDHLYTIRYWHIFAQVVYRNPT